MTLARKPDSAAAAPPITMRTDRRHPVGAEYRPGRGTHFRVWAPKRERIAVVLDGSPVAHPLAPDGGGYFAGLVGGVLPGARYRFRLDDDPTLYPDPASRFQPEGPHGPSQVVDPSAFVWTDEAWLGVQLDGQVVYEMHIGTFTPEGTWAAAARELPQLAVLGVTVLEVMPVADFPGRFGWGYDGVDLFAPTRLYGGPDDFRRFVDRAHALGIAVILDVVYNHFGPDGNYLRQFADAYFSDRYENEWGEAINFDGDDAGPVREFFLTNAACWIEEFHLDGLRLDATQQIFDRSRTHILAEIAWSVRAAAGDRATLLVGENEAQDVRLLAPPETGGCGLDALWNDDLHHSALVALTGRREAYYSDYLGSPQELVSAAKRGFLYQGQHYPWQKKRRGTPALDLTPARLVTYLQNHDQIANSGRGARIHRIASPGRVRAMTAFLLLGPGTPMLFMGQEFAASSPFLYFADHAADLAAQVRRGRAEFLRQFPSLARPEVQAALADPSEPGTFGRCRLDLAERVRHAGAYALHRDLLTLRREDPVLHRPRRGGVDGAVLGEHAFVLRFFSADSGGAGAAVGDRLLLVNLGRDLDLVPAPEPLLAPPAGTCWRLAWSSEAPVYGGTGAVPPVDDEGRWRIQGEGAALLMPQAEGDAR